MTMHELQVWLEGRLDKLTADLSEMKMTLVKQAADIEHHIKRTDLLEERIEQVAQDLQPIKKHINMLEGSMKLIAVLSVIAGLTATLLKIFSII